MLVGYIAFFLILTFALFLPVIWLSRFLWHYYLHSRSIIFPNETLPRVAVILPLRGADPMLEACLSGLLTQDYPAYSVFLVVDSPGDPALAVVSSVLARGYRSHVAVNVEVLREPGERCSLKMSAHLQVLSRLNDEFDVVAFLDADSITRPDWLRSMMAPFSDPTVGATSGIRWFAPQEKSWGSIVRHLFNIGAFALMYRFDIPWGGSQAVRLGIVRDTSLLSFWKQSYAEDTTLTRYLRKLRLRLEYVPAATNFNWEASDLRGAFRFMQRQVMNARLHADHWPMMLLAGLANFLAELLCYFLIVFGLATQTWELAAATAILFAVHGMSLFILLTIAERLVRRRANPPPVVDFALLLVPATFIMQALITYAMIRALFMRTMDWRGITYRIEGRDRIQLLGYSPYRPPRTDVAETQSIS